VRDWELESGRSYGNSAVWAPFEYEVSVAFIKASFYPDKEDAIQDARVELELEDDVEPCSVELGQLQWVPDDGTEGFAFKVWLVRF